MSVSPSNTKKKLTNIEKRAVLKRILLMILGSAILSFGITNIHQRVGITEGGVIGLMLLLNHWFSVSPAYLTPIIDIACYAMAMKILGFSFIKWSVVSTLMVSGFYKLWEFCPYMLPDMSSQPLLAALIGGLFVGVGVGLIVRMGGSSGGDDALALTISNVFKWRLSRAYLISDITILVLSLTYIPFTKIAFSLITVTISSYIIELFQAKASLDTEKPEAEPEI